MKGHLEKLRNRPDHEKKKIVRTLALIATGFIVVIWLIILSLGGNSESEPEAQENTPVESSFMSAINAVLENSSDDFDDMAAGFDDASESFDPENYQEMQSEAEASQDSPASSENPSSFFEDTDNPETINETQNYEE